MSEAVKIDLYFDVASVYTFFAWFVLQKYRELWNLDIELKPVFLPGIIKETGNIPPATLPQKATFLIKDTHRTAKWYGIDSTFQGTPTNFFTASARENLRIQRFIAAALATSGVSQSAIFSLADSAFTSFWMDKRNRDSSNNLKPIDDAYITRVAVAAGFSSEQTAELLAKSGSLGKDELKKNTDEAISLGCFGSPNFLVYVDESGKSSQTERQFFFGSDRFEQLAFFLGKKWLGPGAKL